MKRTTIQLTPEEMVRINELEPMNHLNVMQNLMAVAHNYGVWLDGEFDYDFQSGIITYPSREMKVEYEE